MWAFHLAGAEMGFRHGRPMVFQIRPAHRPDAVPLMRDHRHAQPAFPPFRLSAFPPFRLSAFPPIGRALRA
jgi:cyclopropane-fatty-acyl-phospholipid synthase